MPPASLVYESDVEAANSATDSSTVPPASLVVVESARPTNDGQGQLGLQQLVRPDVVNITDSSTSCVAEALRIIHDISPLPKCKATRTRKRRMENSEVLTSSPYKQRLMEKKPKKTARSPLPTKMAKNEGKAKTKLTCRLNKPRGRKPKATVSADSPISDRQLNKPTGSKNANVDKNGKVGKNSKSEKNIYAKKTLKVKKASKKATKQSTGLSEDLNEQDVPCIFRGEMFSESHSSEQWIQCVICQGWCHVDCSSGESSQGFMCDLCI